MVKKSFLVCGITNDLEGSENHLIRCSRELAEIQLPYIQEDDDDPFQDCDEPEEDDDEHITVKMTAMKQRKITV